MTRLSKSLPFLVPAIFVIIIVSFSFENQMFERTTKDFLIDRYWEKYELSGARTDYDDQLVMEFFPNWNSDEMIFFSVKVNDKTYFGMPTRIKDNYVTLQNIVDSSFIFIPDSVEYVYGELLGENDLIIRTLSWNDTCIYMKKRLPTERGFALLLKSYSQN